MTEDQLPEPTARRQAVAWIVFFAGAFVILVIVGLGVLPRADRLHVRRVDAQEPCASQVVCIGDLDVAGTDGRLPTRAQFAAIHRSAIAAEWSAHRGASAMALPTIPDEGRYELFAGCRGGTRMTISFHNDGAVTGLVTLDCARPVGGAVPVGPDVSSSESVTTGAGGTGPISFQVALDAATTDAEFFIVAIG